MRKSSPVLIFVLGLATAVLTSAFTAVEHLSEVRGQAYQLGDAVANFRLKNTDGNFVSLSDFGNTKGAIVIFTSNHCPFARAYEDRIIALNARYASQGYPVIAINSSDPAVHQDDTFEKMKERSASKNYGYPYLVDDSQQTARAFGVGRMPQVYVLEKSTGKFVVRYIGMIDDNPQDPGAVTKNYLDEAVSSLIKGKPVVTPLTKPVGCAIKWKGQ